MAIVDTRIKLQQWAAWLRGGLGLGYVSPSGEILKAAIGNSIPIAPIGDDVGMAYDRVVAALKRENEPLYRVIKLSYVEQMSNSTIARELGMARQTVQRRIEAAEDNLAEKFILHERLKKR